MNKRTADRDTLLHAARQFVRVFHFESREPDHIDETPGTLLAFRAIEAQHMDRKHDVVEYSSPRQQRGALENDTDVPARADDWRAVEKCFSTGDFREAAQDLQQRALSAPARTDNGQEFTLLDREIDGRQRKDIVAISCFVDLRQITADNRVGALLLALAATRSSGVSAVARKGVIGGYFAGTMAMMSISTSMPGNASWLTFRKVWTGSGASPYCSARIADASFQYRTSVT